MAEKKKKGKVTIKCPECGKEQGFDLKNMETLKNYEPFNVPCTECDTVFWVAKISDRSNRLMKEAKESMCLPEIFLTVCGDDCVLIITPAAPIPEPEEA